MSDKEFLNLIGSIPALTKRLNKLENEHTVLKSENTELKNKYAILETENTNLKSELTSFRVECSVRFNQGEQYSRKNCLCVHKLLNVPTNVHGTEFSKFSAKEMNKLFEHLPFDLAMTHHDIDASHILYYEYEGRKRYPVIVIKFINRDLRNDIFNFRDVLNRHHTVVSEHLTVDNRKLLEAARNHPGSDDAYSEQCKVFAVANGRKQMIDIDSDLSNICNVSNNLTTKSDNFRPKSVFPTDPPRLKNSASNHNGCIHPGRRNFHHNNGKGKPRWNKNNKRESNSNDSHHQHSNSPPSGRGGRQLHPNLTRSQTYYNQAQQKTYHANRKSMHDSGAVHGKNANDSRPSSVSCLPMNWNNMSNAGLTSGSGNINKEPWVRNSWHPNVTSQQLSYQNYPINNPTGNTNGWSNHPIDNRNNSGNRNHW